jgi:hypothetical protein
VLVGGGWYGSVVVESGCWGRARPPRWPVCPYLAPTLTASISATRNSTFCVEGRLCFGVVEVCDTRWGGSRGGLVRLDLVYTVLNLVYARFGICDSVLGYSIACLGIAEQPRAERNEKASRCDDDDACVRVRSAAFTHAGRALYRPPPRPIRL